MKINCFNAKLTQLLNKLERKITKLTEINLIIYREINFEQILRTGPVRNLIENPKHIRYIFSGLIVK